ncbi:SpvB/TcaC N-terminal domain-containing protein, partial [Bathymodiolus thermophilus thioautotrophic gill symbiont]
MKSITMPKLSIPKSGGSFSARTGSYEVGNQGEGSFGVPLGIPNARGVKPSLHLSYNSGSGMEVFGLGFNLTLPHITRNLDYGVP